MPDEQQSRDITDDMRLSELTVGEFKQLVRDLLTEQEKAPRRSAEPPIEKVTVRRKSLDEFMNDLGGGN